MVVEADADAFFVGLIGSDFVPEPALEQNNFSGFSGIFHKGAILIAMLWKTRRRGHEFTEAWVFEFDAGASFRGIHVICAADKGERVEVEAVDRLARHDVDPTIAHGKATFAQIHFQMGNECLHMFVDPLLQLAKRRGKAMQLRH